MVPPFGHTSGWLRAHGRPCRESRVPPGAQGLAPPRGEAPLHARLEAQVLRDPAEGGRGRGAALDLAVAVALAGPALGRATTRGGRTPMGVSGGV